MKKSVSNAFRKSWKVRHEAQYNHWCRGTVTNQVQLAFRSHWNLFNKMLQGKTGRVLEVGCGRGSISSYFADNGYDCHLLDYSLNILQSAKSVFRTANHQAVFVQGDAGRLPYADNTFIAVVSIGLLEHFESVEQVLSEQIRVLAPGGRLLAYIVPERPDNIQKNWNWLNRLLRVFIYSKKDCNNFSKPDIYRNDYNSNVYLNVLQYLPVLEIDAIGLYPLPLVSHSPEFPFSLLPVKLELFVTGIFRLVLLIRRSLFRRNPWICSESYGQAFLVTAVKDRR